MPANELVVLCGPPYAGKTFYARQRLPRDYGRVCLEDFYRDNPNGSLRGFLKLTWEECLKHPGVVVDGQNAKKETRESIQNYVRDKDPDIKTRVVRLLPSGKDLQCRWAWQFALAECAVRGQAYSGRLEDPKAWFLNNDNSLGYQEVKADVPLVCNSAFRPTAPALFVQYQALFDETARTEGPLCTAMVEWVVGWCSSNPTGRVIVLVDPAADKTEEEHKASVQDTCATLSRKCLARPVYYLLWQARAANTFMFPPEPGYLAWLQRRHLLALTHPETAYIVATKAHHNAVSTAHVRELSAKRIADRLPQSGGPTALQWMKAIDAVNMTFQDSDLETHIPLHAQCGTSGVAVEQGPCFIHGIVVPDADALRLFDRAWGTVAARSRPLVLCERAAATNTAARAESAPAPRPATTPRSEQEVPREPNAPATDGHRTSSDRPRPSVRIDVPRDVIDKWASPTIIARAPECFSLLQEVETAMDETDPNLAVLRGKCEASAKGSFYKLQISVSLVTKNIQSWSCTCPFKAVCKHLVAMAIRDACVSYRMKTPKAAPLAHPPRPQKAAPIRFDAAGDHEDAGRATTPARDGSTPTPPRASTSARSPTPDAALVTATTAGDMNQQRHESSGSRERAHAGTPLRPVPAKSRPASAASARDTPLKPATAANRPATTVVSESRPAGPTDAQKRKLPASMATATTGKKRSPAKDKHHEEGDGHVGAEQEADQKRPRTAAKGHGFIVYHPSVDELRAFARLLLHGRDAPAPEPAEPPAQLPPVPDSLDAPAMDDDEEVQPKPSKRPRVVRSTSPEPLPTSDGQHNSVAANNSTLPLPVHDSLERRATSTAREKGSQPLSFRQDQTSSLRNAASADQAQVPHTETVLAGVRTSASTSTGNPAHPATASVAGVPNLFANVRARPTEAPLPAATQQSQKRAREEIAKIQNSVLDDLFDL